jgi:hypothetical protein
VKVIKLDLRYRNYWLDIARKEEEEKEEAKRREALMRLAYAVTQHKKSKNP